MPTAHSNAHSDAARPLSPPARSPCSLCHLQSAWLNDASLAVSCRDGTIFNVAVQEDGLEHRQPFGKHDLAVTGLACTGAWLCSGSRDGVVKFWDAQRLKETGSSKIHRNVVSMPPPFSHLLFNTNNNTQTTTRKQQQLKQQQLKQQLRQPKKNVATGDEHWRNGCQHVLSNQRRQVPARVGRAHCHRSNRVSKAAVHPDRLLSRQQARAQCWSKSHPHGLHCWWKPDARCSALALGRAGCKETPRLSWPHGWRYWLRFCH